MKEFMWKEKKHLKIKVKIIRIYLELRSKCLRKWGLKLLMMGNITD